MVIDPGQASRLGPGEEFGSGFYYPCMRCNRFVRAYQLLHQSMAKQYQLAELYLDIISNPQTQETSEVKTLREQVEELTFAVRMLQDKSGYKVIIPTQQFTKP